jgi:hypothetical protein
MDDIERVYMEVWTATMKLDPLVGRHVDSLGDVNFYHQSLTTWSFLAQTFFYATY